MLDNTFTTAVGWEWFSGQPHKLLKPVRFRPPQPRKKKCRLWAAFLRVAQPVRQATLLREPRDEIKEKLRGGVSSLYNFDFILRGRYNAFYVLLRLRPEKSGG